MNILMLGHSASGKTSYMAALYSRMEMGVNDYTMRYDSWTNYHYKRYILSNSNYSIVDAQNEEAELHTISNNIVQGIYPPPTAIKQEYVFKMRYLNFEEIAFNWYDYRGGALMEKEDGSNGVSELMNRVSQSDALIVFLDGTALEEGIDKHTREFRRIVYLVRTAIANIKPKNNTYFPISFVITKDDLCDNVLDSNGFEFFSENLFGYIADSNHIAGLLTCTTINSENIYNVHFPLLFSILHCMHKYEEETIDAYKYRERTRGPLDSIKEFFTDADLNQTKSILRQLDISRDSLQKVINEHNRHSLIIF